jgi:Kef-type K+ transport system membrane component KefB
MKTLLSFVRRGNRNQSVGLITIGLAMLAGSNLAEQRLTGWVTREAVELAVILAGIAATALLFHRGDTDGPSQLERSDSMSNDLRGLRHDLRPITSAFRGGRLIIVLFFVLFMAIFVLGFIVEALKNPSPQSPRPAGGAHRVQGVH